MSICRIALPAFPVEQLGTDVCSFLVDDHPPFQDNSCAREGNYCTFHLHGKNKEK